jgi:rhodanese-related sulfurtransferase
MTSMDMDDADYQKRSAENGGFGTPEQVQQALADPDTIVIDTRMLEEIAQQGGRVIDHVNYKHIPMSNAESCPELSTNTLAYIPENDVKKTILVYCRSGRRAAKAKQILVQEKGYTQVLNAGGYSDVVRHWHLLSLQQQQQQQQQPEQQQS